MQRPTLMVWLLAGVVATLASNAAAQKAFKTATLKGAEEVPPISTQGQGLFIGVIDPDLETIGYSLFYSGLEGNITQAHIHFGTERVNAGVMVFLCTESGNGPAGTPSCASGSVAGTLTAASVVGPSGQGISAGEMAEVIREILDGNGYVNVHSDLHTSGEIRGQIK